MSKEIWLSGKLGKGQFALVDDEDYDRLSIHSWSFCKGYAQAKKSKTMIKMHRLVLNLTDPKILVDHINRNKLDNRKENLRFATPKTSAHNTSPHQKSYSKYKGVNFDKMNQKWKVSISIDSQPIHGGYFEDEYLASLRYDQLARKYHKEFAYLNHPEINNYDNVNQRIYIPKHSSKFIGVSFKDRKWIANIKINKRRKFIGSFDSEIDAAKAYDKALYENRNLRTHKLKYNFPEDYSINTQPGI